MPCRCWCGEAWITEDDEATIVLSALAATACGLEGGYGPARVVRLRWHCPRGHTGDPAGGSRPDLP